MTAVLALENTVPTDFDLNTYRLEEDAEITTLQALELQQGDILPPLPAGYTFDFSGKFGEAGFSGPTFGSIDFSSDGSVQGSIDSTSDSGDFAGMYSIAGNTIEIRLNSGDVERMVFGTDGSTIVVVGPLRYIPR